ncbi:MAG: hypothetical protein M1379_02525 [Firmicutes bacterium]|nr:hypothetical protein [Bacillota bacterium]
MKKAGKAEAGKAEAGKGRENAKSSFGQDLREGAQYFLRRKPLLYLVLLFTFMNFALGFNMTLGQPYILSMGTKQQLGFLQALFGGGMVLGGLLMATLKMKSGYVRMVLLGNLGVGVTIAIAGLSRDLRVIGLAWLATGLLIPVVNATVVSLLQLRTGPGYLGRVFSFSRMLAWIFLPVGQILAGQLADRSVQAGFPARSGSWLAPLFASGKQGSYGMLLAFTGLFIILAVIGFGLLKPVYELEGDRASLVRDGASAERNRASAEEAG